MIDRAWEEIIRELGYRLDDDHLRETPKRVARFMEEWHTIGKAPPKLTVFADDTTDQAIVVSGIPFYSMCAHHGLPFLGTAAIGYVPDGKIVGLSKFARVVDHFARRFQVQERLTSQIAEHLEGALQPKGIGVVLRAEHLCMSMRGIQRPGHTTTTSDLRGVFRESVEARAELFALIK